MPDVLGEILNGLTDRVFQSAFDDSVRRTQNRPKHPMPEAIRDALTSRDLMGAYDARPPYQRNDYLGWIARAKTPETRNRRVETMLRELASQSGYMGQPYDATARRRAP